MEVSGNSALFAVDFPGKVSTDSLPEQLVPRYIQELKWNEGLKKVAFQLDKLCLIDLLQGNLK